MVFIYLVIRFRSDVPVLIFYLLTPVWTMTLLVLNLPLPRFLFQSWWWCGALIRSCKDCIASNRAASGHSSCHPSLWGHFRWRNRRSLVKCTEIKCDLNFFSNVGSPKETTNYGLYFSHHLHIHGRFSCSWRLSLNSRGLKWIGKDSLMEYQC